LLLLLLTQLFFLQQRCAPSLRGCMRNSITLSLIAAS